MQARGSIDPSRFAGWGFSLVPSRCSVGTSVSQQIRCLDPFAVIPDALPAPQLLPFVHLAIGSMLNRADRPGVWHWEESGWSAFKIEATRLGLRKSPALSSSCDYEREDAPRSVNQQITYAPNRIVITRVTACSGM